MIMARKTRKNGSTRMYAAVYWRRFAAVRRGRGRVLETSDADGAVVGTVDMIPPSREGGGERESLVRGVLGTGVLPCLQAGDSVGLVRERLAQGLGEVGVDEIHERQPLEVRGDGLGDLGELFVDLLAAVELRLLTDECRIGQDLVAYREQELLRGELEGRLLVGVEEQSELRRSDLVLAQLQHRSSGAAPVAGHQR